MCAEIQKGTPECREKCHVKGCSEEIALACTCDDRILEGIGRIINDTRKKDETLDKFSTRKTTQKIEDQRQIIQLSLALTINERGERGSFRRFDI